jgi:hypothetical protein
MDETNSDRVRMILESRMLEIYESLLDIRERVDKNSQAYKDATKTMDDISKTVDVKKIRQREVRIDSNSLKFEEGKLSGKIILSDNEKVYELDIKDNDIKNCRMKEGGFKQLEWIVTQLETNKTDLKPKKK